MPSGLIALRFSSARPKKKNAAVVSTPHVGGTLSSSLPGGQTLSSSTIVRSGVGHSVRRTVAVYKWEPTYLPTSSTRYVGYRRFLLPLLLLLLLNFYPNGCIPFQPFHLEPRPPFYFSNHLELADRGTPEPPKRARNLPLH